MTVKIEMDQMMPMILGRAAVVTVMVVMAVAIVTP